MAEDLPTQPDDTRPEGDNPLALFYVWFDDAKQREPDPTAMAVATVDGEGRPSSRMVLLKGADERGFVFYTNLESRKGRDLTARPWAALLFYWRSLGRQVRVEGRVEQVSDAEADEYFATRPRGAQIGAWASLQSRAMTGRFDLERRVAEYAAKFGFGRVPRPEIWSGLRIVPDRYEFWQEGAFRLHDRTSYRRAGDRWQIEKLYP